jgi:hypothetical protein
MIALLYLTTVSLGLHHVLLFSLGLQYSAIFSLGLQYSAIFSLGLQYSAWDSPNALSVCRRSVKRCTATCRKHRDADVAASRGSAQLELHSI